MKAPLSIIAFTFLNHVFISIALPKDFEVELIQVIFRHGDRTAQKEEIFKGDPYDDNFLEFGYGQLTTTGMKREFKIGKMLRERYNTFLGEPTIHDIYAYSTDFDRTKMSLQLVLAGMNQPLRKTLWNDDLLWTPFPAHYVSRDIDFLTTWESCPKFGELLIEAENSPEIQKRLEKHTGFLDRIRNETQITDQRPFTVFMLHNSIRSALSMGLSLPDWCSEEDYQSLQDIAGILYDCLAHTEKLRRTLAGPVIDQFIQNINKEDGKKVYLYGAHDFNLAVLSRAHGFTGYPAIPDFGTALIIEKLRGKDNQIYIRMALWTGTTEELIPVKVKNCDSECPLSEYLNLMDSVMPDAEVKKCTTVEKLCHKERTRSKKINPNLRKSYILAGNDLYSFKYGKEMLH